MAKGKSARRFNLDLKKFGETTVKQAEQIFRKIALDLDTSVVLDTPVDEGTARGNWYPSINFPSNDIDEDLLDPSGGESIRRITKVVAIAKLGDVIWLTNNLPYILPLENGHSGQAPDGMVDVNVQRAAAIFGGTVVR